MIDNMNAWGDQMSEAESDVREMFRQVECFPKPGSDVESQSHDIRRATSIHCVFNEVLLFPSCLRPLPDLDSGTNSPS